MELQNTLVPEEAIISKIYYLREQKVMLDRDLAELYGVQTRTLMQAVKRNVDRFPEDFMFQLKDEEFQNWKSQIVISKGDKMGLRKRPYAFTEQGVAMLSSVLNSASAIKMNIQIIRLFTKMRQLLFTHKDLLLKVEQIEQRLESHDEQLLQLFNYLKRLAQKEEQPRNSTGYKTKENNV